MVQGQSGGTLTKEGYLALVLRYHLRRLARQPQAHTGRYLGADLNAGEGTNVRAGVTGTPRVTIDALRAMMPTRVHYLWFVDRSPQHIRRLTQRTPYQMPFFEPPSHYEYVRQDNATFLRGLVDRITALGECAETSQGHLLCDPNGVAQTGPRAALPLRELGEFAARCRQWLVLVHWNFEAARRVVGARISDPTRTYSGTLLEEIFSVIPRKFWLISEPFGHSDGHSVLAGSPYYMPPRGTRPFALWPLESPRGAELRRLQSGHPETGRR